MDEQRWTKGLRALVRRVLRRLAAGRRTPGRAAERGMTLIEIMVVIAIIGLIMGAVAFLVIPRFRHAQKDTAKIEAQKVFAAAAEYYIRASAGSGCPTPEDLAHEDLIQEQQEKDPWHNEFQITCESGAVVEVRSAGPDGNMGNDDDIFYAERSQEEHR